jgi:epoxyqueuosine reductase
VKSLLEERARELGFDACRVTDAQPPASAQQFQNWIHRGLQGEMAYLARNAFKRIDPQRVLPGAKSIITLAVSYAGQEGSNQYSGSSIQSSRNGPAPTSQIPDSLNTERRKLNPGVIARYARSTDYHDVLGEQLKQLASYVTSLGDPTTRSLWYVDTGPLLERDLAQRAGLGFIGKHTSLISRTLGNWFFLAEIMTTLELEPDPPERNHCGRCTRCIAACPTQAITAPFQLDARRCISYLTIELKGSIPIELRPAMGHRIFGCDDCLEACPWNRFAREGRMMKEHARNDLTAPGLIELLLLDDAAFRRRFAGTPILRAKRRGLLRNVCVALGNTGDVSVLPALSRATADAEPLIAEHARWAMEQIESRHAVRG